MTSDLLSEWKMKLKEFAADPSQTFLACPPTLSGVERRQLHIEAERVYHINAVSQGNAGRGERVLTFRKDSSLPVLEPSPRPPCYAVDIHAKTTLWKATIGRARDDFRGDTHSSWYDTASMLHPITPRDDAAVRRVKADVSIRGLTDAKFHWVPSHFYKQRWEWRRDSLGLASISHSCKSMLLENTSHSDAFPRTIPRMYEKYYVAILPYTERIDTTKICKFFRAANPGIGKKWFNFRVCESGEAVSGFTHGSFTPFGMLTRMPVLLSDRIPALGPGRIAIGGGHIDLKLEISIDELVRSLQPTVVDFTTTLTESEIEAAQPGSERSVPPGVYTTPVVLDPLHSDMTGWREHWEGLRQDLARHPILGLDMEWTTVRERAKQGGGEKRSCTKSPVALVQIGTANRCLLFRWCNIVSRLEMCNETRDLHGVVLDMLQDKNIIKCGVGILGDRNKFYTDFGVKIASCVELAVLRRKVDPAAEGGAKSLKGLAQEICSVTMRKDCDITFSDWAGGTHPLTLDQIQYAADDAMFSHLVAETLLFRFEPDAKHHAEILQSVMDMHPPVAPSTTFPARVTPGVMTGMKGKYYHNIRVFGPEGEFLFIIDDAKEAEWYVHRKKLGKVTEWRERSDGRGKEIAEIQLYPPPDLEKPWWYHGWQVKNRSLKFHQAEKENICVICGTGSNLVRHMVIPPTFRKRLPAEYIRHNNFDMLLVCGMCHVKIGPVYSCEKKKVAQHYVRIPEGMIRAAKVAGRKAWLILSGRKGVKCLPQERVQQLEACFEDVSDTALAEVERKAKYSLGDIVMDAVLALGNQRNADAGFAVEKGKASHIDFVLSEFIIRWRTLFVESFQPKFLPEGWGIRVGLHFPPAVTEATNQMGC